MERWEKVLKRGIVLLSVMACAYGNLFVITDKKGKVVHSRTLSHTENACLNQKATEYSLQAIYDELHRAENLAKRAEAARKRVRRIAKAQAEAKKAGKVYHISLADKKKLLEDAKYFKGGKYVWGGTTPEGFDCSGYVQYLYKKHGINLPRTAWSQSKKGEAVDREDLQKGDLLFFLTDKKRGIPVTHVGIYIGNGKFIHAASKKKGIIISPIRHGYYAKKFVTARRVINKV
jgi:cell wall-associated NlpC family hydrolase